MSPTRTSELKTSDAATSPVTDFSTVTETPTALFTRQAIAMNIHRYRLAASRASGRRVLEVACGVGQGLGLLARTSKSLVAGDVTLRLLHQARRHYGDRFPLYCFDAQAMPFADHSFDLIVFFEAIYYLPSPSTFLMECRRLLRPGGELVISTINREWSDFNPSPFSRHYFSAGELAGLLEEASFQSDLLGAFPTEASSLSGKMISTLKRVAVKAGWIPKTMKGKELLKRIFLGPLLPLPAELPFEVEGESDTVPIPPGAPWPHSKIIYAFARPKR